MTDLHRYSLFGLHIQSDFHLPELFPAEAGTSPDIWVRRGTLAGRSACDKELSSIEGRVLLEIENIANFAISCGSEIIVQPELGVPERNVRLYLLGTAMGVLLHQRGLLPLHGNAIEIEGKAFVFMGHSGAGKSTLAAWFHDEGYRIIADDVSVIGFDEDGQPRVRPGIPRLRLWRDTLDATGRNHAAYKRSYAGDERYDKYDVPISTGSVAKGDVELSAIYLLARSDRFELSPLSGMRAADAIFANTYRGQYVESLGQQRPHWEAALKLIQKAPIFRLARRWDLSLMRQEIEPVLTHARMLAGLSI